MTKFYSRKYRMSRKDEIPLGPRISMTNERRSKVEKYDKMIELVLGRPNNFNTLRQELLVSFRTEPKNFPINLSADVAPKSKLKFLVNFDGTYPSYKNYLMAYEGHTIHIMPKILENKDINDDFVLELLKKDKAREKEYLKSSRLSRKKKQKHEKNE